MLKNSNSNKGKEEASPLLESEGYADEFRAQFGGVHRARPARTMTQYRAKSIISGAAMITKKAPDFMTSCWVSILISAMVFVSLWIMLMTTLPPNMLLRQSRNLHKGCLKHSDQAHTGDKENSKVHVFYQVILNMDEEFNFNNYTWYLSRVLTKYPDFDFKLYILQNDTAEYLRGRTSGFDRIWKLFTPQQYQNLFNLKDIQHFVSNHSNIEVISMKLSRYLDNTPIKNKWISVKPSIVPFLVKAVTVWEQGGIALDIDTLRYNSVKEYKLYKEIIKVFDDFIEPQSKTNFKHDTNYKPQKTINNIRDVINSDAEIKEEPYLFMMDVPDMPKNTYIDTSIPDYGHDNLFDILHSNEIKVPPMKSNSIKIGRTLQSENAPIDYVDEAFRNKRSISKDIKDNTIKIEEVKTNVTTQGKLLENDKARNTSKDVDVKTAVSSILAPRTPLIPNYPYGPSLEDVSVLHQLMFLFAISNVLKNKMVAKMKNEDHHNSKLSPNFLEQPLIQTYKFSDSSDIYKAAKDLKSNVGPSVTFHTRENYVLPPFVSHFYKNRDKRIDLKKRRSLTDSTVNLLLDINGKFVATKLKCHAFLGQVMHAINAQSQYNSPRQFIELLLKLFCNGSPRKHESCPNIKILGNK